jgi:hypothetical protein
MGRIEGLLDAGGSFRGDGRGHIITTRGYSERGGLLSFEDTNYFLGRAVDVMDVERGIEELLVTPNR